MTANLKGNYMNKSEISIEVKGKTYEEAVQNGLNELKLSLGDVTIETVKEEKGFLGIGKSITVKLTKKESQPRDAEGFLNTLFEKMGLDAVASANETEENISVNISGDSTGVLIGRRGETLDALQYLTSLVVNKDKENYKRVFIDTENYRKKREETLVKLANRIANKVEKTGKRVVLEPMNPYERRVLHATLQKNPNVETISEGEEPFRRVIIKKRRPYKAANND